MSEHRQNSLPILGLLSGIGHMLRTVRTDKPDEDTVRPRGLDSQTAGSSAPHRNAGGTRPRTPDLASHPPRTTAAETVPRWMRTRRTRRAPVAPDPSALSQNVVLSPSTSPGTKRTSRSLGSSDSPYSVNRNSGSRSSHSSCPLRMASCNSSSILRSEPASPASRIFSQTVRTRSERLSAIALVARTLVPSGTCITCRIRASR